MVSKKSIVVLAVITSSIPVLSACDVEESTPDPTVTRADHEPSSPEIEGETFDWNTVPMPAIPGIASDFTGIASDFAGPAQTPVMQPWNVETFQLFTNPDFLSVTQAAGGLFLPQPNGMQPLPPELVDGFLLTFTFRDLEGNIAGFGSIQEVIDFQTTAAETHYMLTMPGRGTLMLAQEENNEALFAELFDMIADQEFVRVYDPPLVFINTVPGTNKIIGGTGEFAHAKGIWREFAIVNEFNFLTGIHDVGNIVQIVHL
jgi:hypothetical protein